MEPMPAGGGVRRRPAADRPAHPAQGDGRKLGGAAPVVGGAAPSRPGGAGLASQRLAVGSAAGFIRTVTANGSTQCLRSAS